MAIEVASITLKSVPRSSRSWPAGKIDENKADLLLRHKVYEICLKIFRTGRISPKYKRSKDFVVAWVLSSSEKNLPINHGTKRLLYLNLEGILSKHQNRNLMKKYFFVTSKTIFHWFSVCRPNLMMDTQKDFFFSCPTT